MNDGDIISFLIAGFISILALIAIIRVAVKQAIRENSYKKESLMKVQVKQMRLLADIAIKLGVEVDRVNQIINE